MSAAGTRSATIISIFTEAGVRMYTHSPES